MTNHMIGAYFLWLFLGWCSAHRFFLGRKKSAFRQLGLLVGGVVCIFIAAWGGGDVTSYKGIQSIEFERVIFLMVGVLMYIVWAVWLLADAVLIALIALDEEREADFAREMGYMQPASRSKLPPSTTVDPSEPEPARSALPPGHVMPWRQEKDEEREIYKVRGD